MGPCLNIMELLGMEKVGEKEGGKKGGEEIGEDGVEEKEMGRRYDIRKKHSGHGLENRE